MCRMQQAVPVQQGAQPISASAGQLYGTDGNPVVLKVCPFSHFCPDAQYCMLRGLHACLGQNNRHGLIHDSYMIPLTLVNSQDSNSLARIRWTANTVSSISEAMQGVNWFGFETSATMVAGLWAGSSSLTQDFKTVVWRLKLLGFNAVRLPFSFRARIASCYAPAAQIAVFPPSVCCTQGL